MNVLFPTDCYRWVKQMFKLIAITVAGVAMVGAESAAAQRYEVHPVRIADEEIRFRKGTPTIHVDGQRGSIQLTPIGMEHGSFTFGVAALNKQASDSDFDVSNISASLAGVRYGSFSREELDKRAKNRAMWASIAVAVVGGIGAAAASSQRDYYRSTLVTPRGTYRSFYSAPSVAGQVQAAAITAGTVYSLSNIQKRLDETREALGDEIVQRTTLGEGESYSGRVVLHKIKLGKQPQRLDVVVDWQGESYRFGFMAGKRGFKAPPIAPTPPRVLPEEAVEVEGSAAPPAEGVDTPPADSLI